MSDLSETESKQAARALGAAMLGERCGLVQFSGHTKSTGEARALGTAVLGERFSLVQLCFFH